MGYCFQLRVYDTSGNHVDRFEYAGSYGAGTMMGFLTDLRDLCDKISYALPGNALFFAFEEHYDNLDCSEILDCLEGLKRALMEGEVSWRDKDRQTMLDSFIEIFSKAVITKGYIKQTFSE